MVVAPFTMGFRFVRQFARLLAGLRLQFDGYRIVGCAPVRAWDTKKYDPQGGDFFGPTCLGLDRCEGCPLLKQKVGRPELPPYQDSWESKGNPETSICRLQRYNPSTINGFVGP